jgi:hypothetical protein
MGYSLKGVPPEIKNLIIVGWALPTIKIKAPYGHFWGRGHLKL